jgi:phosphate transport system protein
MAHEHIVKAFDEQLDRLTNMIARMGGIAEGQIAGAIQAVIKRGADLAASVVETDHKVDVLEREIDEQAVSLLALRQPMASDLRTVVSALRIASDVERIADYAANVAKRAIALAQMAPVRPVFQIPRMGMVARDMVRDVLDAYVTHNVDKAITVWNRDEELDEIYSSLFRELLTYMMEDPRNITACTHLLFIAKNIERIGDHVTNISETIHYLVVGKPLLGERPKGDFTSFVTTRAQA